MKKIVLLFLAAFLAGCNHDEYQPVDVKLNTPTPTPTKAPDTTPTPTPTQVKDTSQKSKRLYPLETLQKVDLKSGGNTIHAWVMDDESKRQEGLMWIEDMDIKPDQGMIFVFPAAAPQGFWMENTLIPLDIVYISAKKKVVSVSHGKPLDETQLKSDADAQYVLELKTGQAAKFGLTKGAAIEIPPSVKTTQ